MENVGEGCEFVGGFCYFNMAEIFWMVEYLVGDVDRVGNKLVCLHGFEGVRIEGDQ